MATRRRALYPELSAGAPATARPAPAAMAAQRLLARTCEVAAAPSPISGKRQSAKKKWRPAARSPSPPPRIKIIKARPARGRGLSATAMSRSSSLSDSTTTVRGADLPILAAASRARGADDGGRRRRDASCGVARDSHPVSTTTVRGALTASLAERTASPWTATSMRDRPAGCSTCASSLCGAVCGNGWSPAADVDGLLVAIGRRRGFGAALAMMVPRRSGATFFHRTPSTVDADRDGGLG